MQTSSQLILTHSQKIISNPEFEQPRCRICYQDNYSRPLITLCECTGSIGFTHEDCIIDWITKKLQTADPVQMPKCEICRCTYSAKLKIGNKKVCFKTFISKIKKLHAIEIGVSLIFLLGTILAFYINSVFVFEVVSKLWTLLFGGGQFMMEGVGSIPGILIEIFTTIVFPLFYVRSALQNGKERCKLWEESLMQVVELTLTPKIVLKK